MPTDLRDAGGSVTIRRAKPDDMLAVARIYLAAFPDSVEQLHLERVRPRAVADLMRIPLQAEPWSFFVADAGDRLIGYAICPAHADRIWLAAIRRGLALRMLGRWLAGRYGLGLRSAVQAMSDKIHCWRGGRRRDTECPARVLSIAVDPTAHGQGTGRQLLHEGLHYLQREGAFRVRLEVRPHNEPAKRLYESVGFRTVGTIHDTRGPWEVMLLAWEDYVDTRS